MCNMTFKVINANKMGLENSNLGNKMGGKSQK